MSTNKQPRPEQTPHGQHLTVRPVGPAEVHFLFEHDQKRLGNAIGVSVLTHAIFVVLIVLIFRLVVDPATQAALLDQLPEEIVWLAQPGPGGGGGGGNKSPDPPKKAEVPGKEKVTVPVIKTPDPDPVPKEEPPPELNIPAKEMAADLVPVVGVLDSTVTDTASTGSGSGGGAGAGEGSGLGVGSGGGTGGGVFQPGNGVDIPRLIRQVKPSYTSEAMRAKVQGVALLECVVETDGGVRTCTVKKSLDSAFGLDQEAMKAAKQWRFQPGTRFGEPVRVLVTIELTFTLR